MCNIFKKKVDHRNDLRALLEYIAVTCDVEIEEPKNISGARSRIANVAKYKLAIGKTAFYWSHNKLTGREDITILVGTEHGTAAACVENDNSPIGVAMRTFGVRSVTSVVAPTGMNLKSLPCGKSVYDSIDYLFGVERYSENVGNRSAAIDLDFSFV